MKVEHRISKMFMDALETSPSYPEKWAADQASRVLELVKEGESDRILGFKVIRDSTIPDNEIHIRYS